LAAGLLVLSPLLGGCLQADTLGDKPPDEVQVGSPPAWDNGMGELMTLKCGVCHQRPLPKNAPDETGSDYDFTVQHASGEGGGAADALGDIKEIVRGGEMPPDFATPLTDAERQAILDWDGS
jgi:mono/diheme cytochrome c family protein